MFLLRVRHVRCLVPGGSPDQWLWLPESCEPDFRDPESWEPDSPAPPPVLAVLAVVVLYLVGQTRWAAGRLSAWISDNSEYRLSIGKITHSWSQPDQIGLEDVQLARSGQPQALVAKRVDLGLSLRQITEPRYFHSVTLRDGLLQPQVPGVGSAVNVWRTVPDGPLLVEVLDPTVVRP